MKQNRVPLHEKNKISILDNVFYWVWRAVSSGGFADRSFAMIAVIQFAYLLLVPSIVLALLDVRVQLYIYNHPKPVALPLLLVFILLLGVNMRIYDEKRYIRLAHRFRDIPVSMQRKFRTNFFLFIWVTILVIAADIMLLFTFHSQIAYQLCR